MKIAILSDSHRKTEYTKETIARLKSFGAEYLVHAGDLELKEHLDILKDSNLPYVAVFGNNDYNLIQYANQYNIKKEPYYFKIKDYKFKLMHLPYYLTGDTDIVISGHTHIFEHSYINDTVFINPGEICAREQPIISAVLLEITDNKYIINRHTKDINSTQWEIEEFIYDK